MIACRVAACVVTCALLAVASVPCSLALFLSEHHCAQNNELSESVCFMFVLSLFICLKVVSRNKEPLFRAKMPALSKANAAGRWPADRMLAGGKPPVLKSGSHCSGQPVHQCFLFQNEIKYFLDTLIQKIVFFDNKNK